MDSEGYRRLNAAFTALAEQSNVREVQLRWVALAQESSSLAMDRVALLLNRLANG